MKSWRAYLLTGVLIAQTVGPAMSESAVKVATSPPGEPTANVQAVPRQILKTGINLNVTGLAPNSLQLADTIGLMPVLDRIQALRSQIGAWRGGSTLESLTARQDLLEAKQQAELIIQKADLEIDYTIAEMTAEQNVYSEILGTFTSQRDKAVFMANAASYVTNGALWAVAEALDIPTWKRPKYAISSGTTGIIAGLVPSFASLYAMKIVNGKKRMSEAEPNMLAKLFGYPTVPDIEYPRSVWQFLNQPPADDPKGKTRRDQLVDRWIADANIPAFTDRTSRKQLDVITASVAQRKGLSIATLTVRQVMLQQLSAEIMKMKRMLLELAMTVLGEKQLSAKLPDGQDYQPRVGMRGIP